MTERDEVTLSVYPNPIVDRVSIQFPEATKAPSVSNINIFDQVGRSYPVNALWHAENTSMEIDFTEMRKERVLSIINKKKKERKNERRKKGKNILLLLTENSVYLNYLAFV